jgi:Co/Zn/Cd efflux system component
MTFAGAWPLLKRCGEMLLQRTPRSLEGRLHQAFKQILSVNGVLGYSKIHFWELNQGEYVGSILIQISSGANDQYIQVAAQNILRPIGVKTLTIQIEKDVIAAY